MTKPSHPGGTTQSTPPVFSASGSSETVPPFEFNREAAENPSAAEAEKLFSLFAQAVFSTLPSEDVATSGSALSGNANPEGPSPHIPKLKALVVGFTEGELIPLCYFLSNLKFATVTASTADQALEMLAVHPVALLLLDWDLPLARASALAQTVRRMSIEQPLIVSLTRQLTEALKFSTESAGIDRLYAKPLSHDLLIDCLRGKGFAVSEPAS